MVLKASQTKQKSIYKAFVAILVVAVCTFSYWHAVEISLPFHQGGQPDNRPDDPQTLRTELSNSPLFSLSETAQRRATIMAKLPLTTDSYVDTEQDSCRLGYETSVSNQTEGLTQEDLRRSRAWVGNEQRLAKFVHKLEQRQAPVHVIACGGSITMGHGVNPQTARYSNRLEGWLNDRFPLLQATTTTATSKGKQQRPQHTVSNRAAHGADMCAMAKRMNLIFGQLGHVPDLVILEFGVNDYQGQDHKINVDHKTDLFFDGFLQKAMCAEAVVYNLIHNYPDTAILFLEFQSAVLTRKTAQLLHMGVAQHYQIPVISYSEVVMPGYYELLEQLEPHHWSAPKGDPVLPFPHGCASRCASERIHEQFRKDGCKSLCDFARMSGFHRESCKPPGGREACVLPFFAHDGVHPSYMGHGVATDLIIHAIASVQHKTCRGIQPRNHALPPKSINFLASNEDLSLLTDFVSVKDTMNMFYHRDQLNSNNHSAGFSYYGDSFAERRGWICTEDKGGNYIEFDINLPQDCYILYLSTLRSYEGMGTFSVIVKDLETKTQYGMEMDGIWEPRISVPADLPLKPNGQNYKCSGKCTVTVLTNPKHADRKGNKVKIMTLSARKCRASDFPQEIDQQ